LEIDPALRKDAGARKALIQRSDYTILCLPDGAAREAVALAEDAPVRIIDASTAHRTNPAWAYGFPELSAEHRKKIETSRRVAVPGCYASGFNALAYPMVHSGLVSAAYPVQCFAVSGYSGGGKKMIAEVEAPDGAPEVHSPRFYGLGNHHKHIPEMQAISGLTAPPMFTPIVDDYFNGMVVCMPFQSAIAGRKLTVGQVHEMLSAHYAGQHFVKVMPLLPAETMDAYKLSSNDLRDTNQMQIFVFGTDDQVLLCARFDNLGKGASGAAAQCLNIMMGVDETTGLC
jgi:N-acetyl-gamma-glutamyl-phosphate reductase